MSVVNKMLKDLENRESSTKVTANYQPSAKTSGANKRLYIILAIGVTAIAGVMLWPQASETSVTPASPAIVPINKVSTKTEPGVMQSTATPAKASVPTTTQQNNKDSLAPQESAQIQMPTKDNVTSDAANDAASEGAQVNQLSRQVTQQQAAVTAPSEPAKNKVAVVKRENTNSTADLKERLASALARNDNQQAIMLLQTLIRQTPDDPGPKKRLAALYFAEGLVATAQELLMNATEQHPADSSVRLMYARLLKQQGEAKIALYQLQDIDNYGIASIELLGYRASLSQELNEFDLALKDYQKLVSIDGLNAKWWLGRAVVADKLNQVVLAIQSYQQAIKLAQLSNEVNAFMRKRLQALAGER